MKNRSANKSVDNTIIRGSSGLNELSKANADNTMKSSVDPEGTTQDSIAPTPFHHQLSTNERPNISGWEHNGRDSQLQGRESALDADSEANLNTPIYVKQRSGISRLSNQNMAGSNRD